MASKRLARQCAIGALIWLVGCGLVFWVIDAPARRANEVAAAYWQLQFDPPCSARPRTLPEHLRLKCNFDSAAEDQEYVAIAEAGNRAARVALVVIVIGLAAPLGLASGAFAWRLAKRVRAS